MIVAHNPSANATTNPTKSAASSQRTRRASLRLRVSTSGSLAAEDGFGSVDVAVEVILVDDPFASAALAEDRPGATVLAPECEDHQGPRREGADSAQQRLAGNSEDVDGDCCGRGAGSWTCCDRRIGGSLGRRRGRGRLSG